MNLSLDYIHLYTSTVVLKNFFLMEAGAREGRSAQGP